MSRILILKEAPYGSREEEPTMTRLMQGDYAGKPEACTICGGSPVVAGARYRNPLGNVDFTHHVCEPCADQYDIMHSSDKYKGEPMDIVMRLLKAYLPTLQEKGRKIDDQVSLRWIPKFHESTFYAPVPFHSSRGNVNWEQRLRNEKLNAPKGSAHSERKTLPGVFEGDSKTPSNNPITGSWVAPATQQGAMGADVSFKDKGLLMAINENPDWWRTVQQGAAQESPAGEGFKFGGFDKEAFSKIPTPNISPISMLHYQMALKNPMLEEDEVAQQFPDEHELITQFPNIKTEDIWGPPADSTINPLKVASEPMDIAMRLLKEAVQHSILTNKPHGVADYDALLEHYRVMDGEDSQMNDRRIKPDFSNVGVRKVPVDSYSPKRQYRHGKGDYSDITDIYEPYMTDTGESLGEMTMYDGNKVAVAGIDNDVQRQGLYDKVFRTALKDKGSITSQNRVGPMSSPFHDKLRQELPQEMSSSGPQEMRGEQMEQPINYTTPTPPQNWGSLEYDVGALPLQQGAD
tara:strand:- start:532 stop:2085 length:1554 start_codon:yes stop_codon:yes gene_type:complete